MKIRKANYNDVSTISDIYLKINDAEENGVLNVGWKRGVYPTKDTAKEAIDRCDMFVIENDIVIGSAIINKIQVDIYKYANWTYPCEDNEVMVMHTLAIDPMFSGKGAGKTLVAFYEEYARNAGCKCLRIDTQEKNYIARSLYKSMGFSEICIIPCVFNGIPNVNLVLLEKGL